MDMEEKGTRRPLTKFPRRIYAFPLLSTDRCPCTGENLERRSCSFVEVREDSSLRGGEEGEEGVSTNLSFAPTLDRPAQSRFLFVSEELNPTSDPNCQI